jgi:hypothetical protein
MATTAQFGARVTPGWESFAHDVQREINLDDYYLPYRQQQAFHQSAAKHPLLGGAAGPGKTLGLLLESLITCNEFNPTDAVQVHTLLLRRTFPQLEGSVITRFREKIPRELYRDYHEQRHTVTWLNAATTTFGSMQHEHDYLNFQGSQWKDVYFDELTQFTFKQWTGIGAWNRCPVSPYSRKGGATNPIGIGAGWVHSLFVLKRPCPEMDANQRQEYRPGDFAYFPCTYLDNPIYANDPNFIASLKQYTKPEREALMKGIWGAFGTYFDIWDPAVHVYPADSVRLEPWWPKWVSGDWGFKHWAAIYWHCQDPLGIVRTYREMVVNKQSPAKLAKLIADRCVDENGQLERYQREFYLSHDAFHEKQDQNTIARQMEAELKKVGLEPANAGTDKVGRERLMYSMLEERIKVGEVFDEGTGQPLEILVPRWQISDAPNCGDPYAPRLVDVIARAPHDEDKPEQIADFEGDDPIAGAGHGIYGKFRGKVRKPIEMQVAERVTATDPTMRHLQYLKAVQDVKKQNVTAVLPRRWRPRG